MAATDSLLLEFFMDIPGWLRDTFVGVLDTDKYDYNDDTFPHIAQFRLADGYLYVFVGTYDSRPGIQKQYALNTDTRDWNELNDDTIFEGDALKWYENCVGEAAFLSAVEQLREGTLHVVTFDN